MLIWCFKTGCRFGQESTECKVFYSIDLRLPVWRIIAGLDRFLVAYAFTLDKLSSFRLPYPPSKTIADFSSFTVNFGSQLVGCWVPGYCVCSTRFMLDRDAKVKFYSISFLFRRFSQTCDKESSCIHVKHNSASTSLNLIITIWKSEHLLRSSNFTASYGCSCNSIVSKTLASSPPLEWLHWLQSLQEPEIYTHSSVSQSRKSGCLSFLAFLVENRWNSRLKQELGCYPLDWFSFFFFHLKMCLPNLRIWHG